MYSTRVAKRSIFPRPFWSPTNCWFTFCATLAWWQKSENQKSEHSSCVQLVLDLIEFRPVNMTGILISCIFQVCWIASKYSKAFELTKHPNYVQVVNVLQFSWVLILRSGVLLLNHCRSSVYLPIRSIPHLFRQGGPNLPNALVTHSRKRTSHSGRFCQQAVEVLNPKSTNLLPRFCKAQVVWKWRHFLWGTRWLSLLVNCWNVSM